MKELKEIRFSTLFDIKAETVAAAMLAQDEQLNLEQLILAPCGTARRRSNHEIRAIRKRFYEYDEAWLIEINRKGLLDTLPENLFLRIEEDYPDSVARAKAFEQQIADARKFFLPFEQATYFPRIEAEQLEQNWTEGFPGFIERIWGLDKFGEALTPRQRFLLSYLLPEAYRITGNWALTGLCFEAVLRKKVNLRFVAPLEYEITSTSELGQSSELGDMVIGDSFRDDIPALEVSVAGVTLEELPEYLPGGNRRKVLEELLCNYFLPSDAAVVTRIVVTEDAWSFTLGQDILGYNIRFNHLKN